MDSDIARWRIAYDTVSALVAVDQIRAERQQALRPMLPSPGSAAAAADRVGGVSCATGDAEPGMSSHHDREMIQRQRRLQQQRCDVARLSQSSLSSLHSDQSNHRQISVTPPTTTSLPGSNHFHPAARMASLGAECDVVGLTGTRGNMDVVLGSQVSDAQTDGAVRLVSDGEALVGLFRRLMDTFYMETMLWMYNNVLLHPAARRTRNRLHWLGVVTGRSLEQAASNVLTGFIAGYRQSRRTLSTDVEETLMATGSSRAGRLAGFAVELGVILNPRQMIRSFSAVVRDLVFRASSQAVLANTSPPTAASRLYRYESDSSSHHHQQHHRQSQQHGTWHRSTHQPVSYSPTRQYRHVPDRALFLPPPPPPYPGFLLHFLSVLVDPPLLQTSVSPSAADVSITDNQSYEELLRLSDAIGEVKERGLKLDDVQHLPSYHVPHSRSDAHSVHMCVICLDEFTSGQMIRALPCCHEYHAKCVDRWLTINRTCPVCRYDIDPQSIQSMTTV